VPESAGDAEADPLGLGDGGGPLLLVAGDRHGSLRALAEGPILGLPVGELSPEVADPGFGRGAVDGLDDLLGLPVERLSGLATILGDPGEVAVSAAEDGEGAGDALRDRGHGGSLRRGRSRVTPTIAQTSTRIVHQLPHTAGRFEIVAWLRYFPSAQISSSRLRCSAVNRPSTSGAKVPSSADAAETATTSSKPEVSTTM
jgi:hypothetical protein